MKLCKLANQVSSESVSEFKTPDIGRFLMRWYKDSVDLFVESLSFGVSSICSAVCVGVLEGGTSFVEWLCRVDIVLVERRLCAWDVGEVAVLISVDLLDEDIFNLFFYYVLKVFFYLVDSSVFFKYFF